MIVRFSVSCGTTLRPFIAAHACADRGTFPRKRKAQRQTLTEELQAKEGIIGELERKIAQLVTSARIKHERETRVNYAIIDGARWCAMS